MEIQIRTETAADVPVIEAVTAAAFLAAPHSSHTEQFIVNALRHAGKLAVSLVAEVDGVVLGHVAASPVSIADGAPGWYGLGPIAVAPAYQGQGVGICLVHEALRALRRLGAAGCVVLGEPGYYGRFGFQAEPALVLPDVPAAYFQALAFNAALPRGSVAYDPAFAATA